MAIKKLQNGFTTPEQSRKLLELGVPADSADMWFEKKNWKRGAEWEKIPSVCAWNEYANKQYSYTEIKESEEDFTGNDTLPCWSVGRLIEIGNICSIPKIKEAGFHLLAQDFDDLIETMIISIKVNHHI